METSGRKAREGSKQEWRLRKLIHPFEVHVNYGRLESVLRIAYEPHDRVSNVSTCSR